MKPSALKVSRMCLPEAGEYIPEEWSLHTSPGLSTFFVSTHSKTLLDTGYRTDENIVWTSVAFVNTPSFLKIVTMIWLWPFYIPFLFEQTLVRLPSLFCLRIDEVIAPPTLS